jgi:transmembrane sensor
VIGWSKWYRSCFRVQIKKVFKTTLQNQEFLHLLLNLKDFMSINFQHVEDVLADESFQAWYFRRTTEEVQSWEKWMDENPGQSGLVQEAITFMNSLPQRQITVADPLLETKLQQLNERLDSSKRSKVPVVNINKTQQRRWWMVAAAAVLLIVAGLSFWNSSPSLPELNTTYGQVASNQLPDGSTMILNANSTAKLSNDWDKGKDREVWLEGEAFFKVTRSPEKSRFIVHTGNLDVIVTGTQFNVMHRNEKTTVMLTEGSVIIRTHDGKELIMNPGDYVEMKDELAKKSAKEENILAWKENKLAFDNATVKDAAQLISNHYGVKIALADEAVGAKTFSGIMPNNNLDDLLKAIEVAIDIRITKKDNDIIFSSKQ